MSSTSREWLIDHVGGRSAARVLILRRLDGGLEARLESERDWGRIAVEKFRPSAFGRELAEELSEFDALAEVSEVWSGRPLMDGVLLRLARPAFWSEIAAASLLAPAARLTPMLVRTGACVTGIGIGGGRLHLSIEPLVRADESGLAPARAEGAAA